MIRVVTSSRISDWVGIVVFLRCLYIQLSRNPPFFRTLPGSLYIKRADGTWIVDKVAIATGGGLKSHETFARRVRLLAMQAIEPQSDASIEAANLARGEDIVQKSCQCRTTAAPPLFCQAAQVVRSRESFGSR